MESQTIITAYTMSSENQGEPGGRDHAHQLLERDGLWPTHGLPTRTRLGLHTAAVDGCHLLLLLRHHHASEHWYQRQLRHSAYLEWDKLGSTFYSLYNVEHYGRMKSLIVNSTYMFVCFVLFAPVRHFPLDREHPQRSAACREAMIVFACFFILGFATTCRHCYPDIAPFTTRSILRITDSQILNNGSNVWTIAGKLYPTRHHARTMAVSTASSWFWTLLLAFFTPFIVGDIDFRYGYSLPAVTSSLGVRCGFLCSKGRAGP